MLAAVDRHRGWCPDIVRDVDVLYSRADGHPSRARMSMHIGRGTLVREFDLFLEIVVERPRIVRLMRVTDHPTNQVFSATWLLCLAGTTHLALELDARLRVPRYPRRRGGRRDCRGASSLRHVGGSPPCPSRRGRAVCGMRAMAAAVGPN